MGNQLGEVGIGSNNLDEMSYVIRQHYGFMRTKVTKQGFRKVSLAVRQGSEWERVKQWVTR